MSRRESGEHKSSKKEALTQLEAYAKEYTGAKFSHGLCPKCFRLEMAKLEEYAVEKPF